LQRCVAVLPCTPLPVSRFDHAGERFLRIGKFNLRIRPGDRLIRLHVWNEQFPAFPAGGPTLAWARRVNRAFEISLRELAHFLEVRPDLDDITGICGNMTFGRADRSARLARFVRRFGFEKIDLHGSQSFRQRMHWFGENILISMIVLTYNATALRADTLWRDRVLVVLSRQTLRRRYLTERRDVAGVPVAVNYMRKAAPGGEVRWQAR